MRDGIPAPLDFYVFSLFCGGNFVVFSRKFFLKVYSLFSNRRFWQSLLWRFALFWVIINMLNEMSSNSKKLLRRIYYE